MIDATGHPPNLTGTKGKPAGDAPRLAVKTSSKKEHKPGPSDKLKRKAPTRPVDMSDDVEDMWDNVPV